jgi:hypothetical protein
MLHEHVLRLDVPVDDPGRVSVGDPPEIAAAMVWSVVG